MYCSINDLSCVIFIASNGILAFFNNNKNVLYCFVFFILKLMAAFEGFISFCCGYNCIIYHLENKYIDPDLDV